MTKRWSFRVPEKINVCVECVMHFLNTLFIPRGIDLSRISGGGCICIEPKKQHSIFENYYSGIILVVL